MASRCRRSCWPRGPVAPRPPVLKLVPIACMTSVGKPFDSIDFLRHLALPASILGFGYMAIFMRYTRASMLDVINAEYITTARQRACRSRPCLRRHAFRNGSSRSSRSSGCRSRRSSARRLSRSPCSLARPPGRCSTKAVNQRDFLLIMGITILLATWCWWRTSWPTWRTAWPTHGSGTAEMAQQDVGGTAGGPGRRGPERRFPAPARPPPLPASPPGARRPGDDRHHRGARTPRVGGGRAQAEPQARLHQPATRQDPRLPAGHRCPRARCARPDARRGGGSRSSSRWSRCSSPRSSGRSSA